MRPRYLEALEESLNDTAHLLAALLERDASAAPDPALLKEVVSRAGSMAFKAKIYALKKDKINVSVYVTDGRGIVIYDSEGKSTGQDFSSWNDVRRTLRGEYGVRATRIKKDDPMTGSLYVAAPVRHDGQIVGVVTVVKPNDSIQPFVRIAERKLLQGAGFAVIAMTLLTLATFFWVTRPLRILTQYIVSVRKHGRLSPPDVGAGEIGELAREFENLRQELEGKSYVEQYVKTMTHEIKSPVTSIRAAAEILAEGNPDEESRKKFLENILTESSRIEDLTRRLLELASIEGQKSLASRERIGSNELIQEIRLRTASRLEKRSQRLEVKSEDVTIAGSRAVLESALVNLVENASDFGPDHSTIALETKMEEGFLKFSVTDQGPGIPEFAISRAFERFYSLPRPDNKRKSTGLGLCFVKEAAELHGGKAEIQNTGGGSASIPRVRRSV
ncbi:MAG TPA: two-component system sensor histidine kinase CreC, partial [Leptospiraceae bacterium]|nr:two-component system sensor histidine kinase CreC [Leptospiraceae bacterium]